MKEATVLIDQAGRIILPEWVLAALAIKLGDAIKVSIRRNTVVLTPDTKRSGFVRKGKALVFSTPGGKSLSREMVNVVLEESRDKPLNHPGWRARGGRRRRLGR